MTKAIINKEICKGCGLCIDECPKKIINLSKGEINAMGYQFACIDNIEACIGCAFCAMMCPDCAIRVE